MKGDAGGPTGPYGERPGVPAIGGTQGRSAQVALVNVEVGSAYGGPVQPAA
jgi:hypothetical protein